MVTTKPGVEFTTIAPAGMRLLEAIRHAAKELGTPVVITSACEGVHSGPNDPHPHGEAYDVRTHDLAPNDKLALLGLIMADLQTGGADDALPVQGGYATRRFFGFLEAAGTPNEHIHVQKRNFTTYTMEDYLAS